MAGSQIATSVTIINSLFGFQAISLTEFGTSAESSIAAGSKVEIGGAFFTFATDEGVTGFSAITTGATCYIAMTPSGTAGSQIVTATWTETEPVWDDAKQGWYQSAGSITRYVAASKKVSAATCYADYILTGTHTLAPAVKILEMGDWNMDETPQLDVPTGVHISQIRAVSAIVRVDSDGAPGETYSLDAGRFGDGPNGHWTFQDYYGLASIRLRRVAGGLFDASDYTETSYNRGWVTVWYA
jgi:hypothetical protein